MLKMPKFRLYVYYREIQHNLPLTSQGLVRTLARTALLGQLPVNAILLPTGMLSLRNVLNLVTNVVGGFLLKFSLNIFL